MRTCRSRGIDSKLTDGMSDFGLLSRIANFEGGSFYMSNGTLHFTANGSDSSGGGSYTWTTAALDDRVRVAAPVAGITDLRNQVVDGCVEGHCDCMFFLNTYRWDFPLNAALLAPRPLLIVNTDADSLFLVCSGEQCTIRRCQATHCDLIAIGLYDCDDCLIEDCHSQDSYVGLGLLGDAAGPSSVLYALAALPIVVAVLAARLPRPAAAPPGTVWSLRVEAEG